MGHFFGRGRNKIQNRLTLIDVYNKYIIDKEENSPYYLTKDIYQKLLHEYIKRTVDYIFLESGEFSFTGRLGTFVVEKKKPNLITKGDRTACIDWNATNEYGKAIYHFNEHSNGYTHEFHWKKTGRPPVKNISSYKFILTRGNKRRLAKLIKSGEYDYREKQTR